MKILILILSIMSSAFAADLKVEITNIKSDDGDIFLALWKGPQGFPSSYTTARQRLIISATENEAVFKDLEPGAYAIAIFHDKNRDSRLNTNRLGIPTEGFGFSNNPRLLFGPPSFKKARFFMQGTDRTKVIQMKHF